jgi:dTDP-4-amino-4,6-dideoxygalactose transaminase
MLLSQDSELLAKAAELRDCEDPRGNDLAFNFKMSDVHAAGAHVRLRRLPESLARRRELAAHHRAALQDAGINLPPEADDREHGW